jgi:hypothetical protein
MAPRKMESQDLAGALVALTSKGASRKRRPSASARRRINLVRGSEGVDMSYGMGSGT